MIDIVGILTLVLGLLLMPADQATATLDVVDVANGSVVTMTAKRADGGFVLEVQTREGQEAEPLRVTQKGDAFVVHLPGESTPIDLDLSKARKDLQGLAAGSPKTLKLEQGSFIVTRSGKLTYVMPKGNAKLLVKHE